MRREVRTLVAVGVAVGVGAVAAFVEVRMKPELPAAAEPTSASAPAKEVGPPADWCAPGYDAIAGGCLAAPSAPEHASLVLYLHGRYEKGLAADETDRQRRVAARLVSRGYAVLAVRGALGGCGAAELSDWYCWPSNDRTESLAVDVVGSWRSAIEETERRVHPERRFVLGFSNGGYFATLLATAGLLAADAYVVAHGGLVEPGEWTKSPAPPLLLLSADDDVAQDDMLRLDGRLTRARWPHDSYARAGGHGLTDQDIDAAVAFFSRSREVLPLDPPIAGLHRPVHHEREAAAPALVSSGDEGEAAAPTVASASASEVVGDPYEADDPSTAN